MYHSKVLFYLFLSFQENNLILLYLLLNDFVINKFIYLALIYVRFQRP